MAWQNKLMMAGYTYNLQPSKNKLVTSVTFTVKTGGRGGWLSSLAYWHHHTGVPLRPNQSTYVEIPGNKLTWVMINIINLG